MDEIKIAPYVDALHRQQAIALWKTVFGYESAHNKPELAIDKKLAVQDQLFFLALAGDAIVGTVMAGYDGHRGWLYTVAVSPAHRRQGIGSRLVSVAEEALISRGCVKINLQILEDNQNVTDFYASLGYSVERRISMGKRIPQNPGE